MSGEERVQVAVRVRPFISFCFYVACVLWFELPRFFIYVEVGILYWSPHTGPRFFNFLFDFGAGELGFDSLAGHIRQTYPVHMSTSQAVQIPRV